MEQALIAEVLPQTITTLALAGIIIFTAGRFALPFAHAALASTSALAMGAYAFSLAGMHAIYGRLFVFAGLALLLRRLVQAWRGRAIPPLSPRALPPLLFAALLLFFIWYFHGVKLVYYDEFFWGNLAKGLLYDGRLPPADGVLAESGVPIYPPGPAILQTLFMGRDFADSGMALGGMLTVLLLFFMAHHQAAKRLDPASALALALLAACIGRCMGTPVNTFAFYRIGYAEYMQGSIFAALLCTAIYEKDARLRAAVLVPGLGLLCLLKATGFLFALGVICCALVAHWSTEDKPRFKDRTRSALKQFALLLLPVAAVWLSWQWHLNSLDFLRKLYPNLATFISSMASMLQDQSYVPDIARGQSYMPDITQGPSYAPVLPQPTDGPARNVAGPTLAPHAALAILNAALKKPLVFSPVFPESVMNVLSSTCSLFAQWTVIFVLLRKFAGFRLKNHEKWIMLILIGGFFGWVSLRLHLALTYHNLAEIMRAASYERYIGAYMSGIVVVVTMMLYMKLALECSPGAARVAKPLLAGNLALMLVICGFNPFSRPVELPTGENLAAMREVADFLEQCTPEGSRIWYLEQGAVKEKPWVLRFLAEPLRHAGGLPHGYWNLGEPGEELQDDTFPSPLPPENIINLAARHRIDFILLWKTDQKFMEKYGPTLGLVNERAPVLLKLGDWLAGKSAHPETVRNCPSKK